MEMASAGQTKPLPSIGTMAQVVVVAVCTLAFVLNAAAIVVTLTTDRYAGSRDFVTYWAAGQQLVRHANPYDTQALLPIERLAGFPQNQPPMVMRNAPPALFAVLPIGVLPVRFASALWGAFLVTALWFAIRTIAQLSGRPHSQLTLIAYAFGPALSCLIAGQMSIFALLGLVLFLKLERERPFLAGAALWLCALKPQIFVLSGIVLLLWVIRTRRYRVLAGLFMALGLTTACVMLLDPHLWPEYAKMMRQENIPNLLIPSISNLLRLAINPAKAWIQLLPLTAGCGWAIWYFFRHRDGWSWTEHGAPLMLVSVLVAPYSWFMDQVVLLPALMKQVYSGASTRSIAVLALLSAGVEFTNFRGVPLGDMTLYSCAAAWWPLWYLWTAYEGGWRPGQSRVAKPRVTADFEPV